MCVMYFKPGARWPKAGMRLVLKIVSVRTSVCVCVCVCVSTPEAITSGVMCCDIDSRRLVKQVL